MIAFSVNLFAGTSGGGSTATATVDMGSIRTFHAWASIHTVDSTAVFDRDNAVVVDIVSIDGSPVTGLLNGGDHFGAPFSSANAGPGALSSRGRRVTFRLRAFHSEDLVVYATGTVLAL